MYIGIADEIKGLAAQVDGLVDGLHQPRHHLLDFRVVDIGEPVRRQHRGRQAVAEIVIDLGDSGAEGGQAGFLLKRGPEFALHHRQFAFSKSDFVGTLAGNDHPGDVLRCGAEQRHAFGNAAHGPNQQPLQRKENQAGGK